MGTCLPVEQDKYEGVFARVQPQDRGEKERGALTGEGKGPRDGTKETVKCGDIEGQNGELLSPGSPHLCF